MGAADKRPDIICVTPEHVELFLPLFLEYRRFYAFEPDSKIAHDFLLERMHRNESTVFMAVDETEIGQNALGFAQLYPSFSSLWMKRIWILYDLFVKPSGRRKGVAMELMKAARDLAERTEAKAIVLETGIMNHPAQCLYTKLGYKKDEAFYRYALYL
jgi:GNAT superfamily N-acetyltransferase